MYRALSEFVTVYGLTRFCGRGRAWSAWRGGRAAWRVWRTGGFDGLGRNRLGL